MEKEYRMSEISCLTGLSIPTLRYYEKLTLLNPKRDSNNYRIFTNKDLNWIIFIKRAKETGLSLDRIVEYSDLRRKGNSTINDRILILENQEKLLYIKKNMIQKNINFLKRKKNYYKKLKHSN